MIFYIIMPPTYTRCKGSLYTYLMCRKAYVLLMLLVFIYVLWCPTQFTFQNPCMLLQCNSNTTSAISEAGRNCLVFLSTRVQLLVLCGVRGAQSLVFSDLFCSKNVNIYLSAHDTFLHQHSSRMLKVKRLENQLICLFEPEKRAYAGNRITSPMPDGGEHQY